MRSEWELMKVKGMRSRVALKQRSEEGKGNIKEGEKERRRGKMATAKKASFRIIGRSYVKVGGRQ